MSTTVVVNRFNRGVAEDTHAGQSGEYTITKHFDTLTYPRRLQPLRGLTTHTTSTGIGNVLSASNGLMYGVGTNSGNGKLWYLPGYGTDDWTSLSTNQLSGAPVNYDLLVEYPDAGNTRTIFWASTNLLVASDPNGASSATTQALTFTSIGQGFVHPKDKILYIPYRTSSTPYIATIGANATAFTTYGATALTLPTQYRVYCLTNWGNYLAIPCTTITAGSNVNSSTVFLWDRDTSLGTLSESIPWGGGYLKVLNNLAGSLIGISEVGSTSVQAETVQDYNSIQIKVYNGAAEPLLVREIRAQHFAGTSARPAVTINPRVNFVYKDRLYFSINVNPNDGISPAYYGLWSVGRDRLTGEYTVILERPGTDDSSDTGVIAAAMAGDFVSICHTTEGTLTRTRNGYTSSSTYTATSLFQSVINPEMPDAHRVHLKALQAIQVNHLPLPSGAQIVLKYRVDSQGSDSDWVTAATQSTAATNAFSAYNAAGVAQYTRGYNYEFRLESTGGAVITSYKYKYDFNPNAL